MYAPKTVYLHRFINTIYDNFVTVTKKNTKYKKTVIFAYMHFLLSIVMTCYVSKDRTE